VNDVDPPVLLAVVDKALGHALQFLLGMAGTMLPQ
jgi:hypothetical protein